MIRWLSYHFSLHGVTQGLKYATNTDNSYIRTSEFKWISTPLLYKLFNQNIYAICKWNVDFLLTLNNIYRNMESISSFNMFYHSILCFIEYWQHISFMQETYVGLQEPPNRQANHFLYRSCPRATHTIYPQLLNYPTKKCHLSPDMNINYATMIKCSNAGLLECNNQ